MEADQRLVPCTVSALVLSLCPQSGLVGIGIAESIDEPRLYTHENLPQGPTWEEVKKLLTGVTGASLLQVRGRCVILLCAVYGFRVGEVCRLRLADIDWAEERISVRHPNRGESKPIR